MHLHLILLMLVVEPIAAQEATLALINARVWTANPSMPWAEAVAARGETILAVGGNAEIRKLITQRTRVIDAGGGMLVPGFIDSHVHFLMGGTNLASGAATERAQQGRIHLPHPIVCGHGAAGDLDHRRRLGPSELGRGTAVEGLDRFCHAPSSRLDQPARRSHESGQQQSHGGRQDHQIHGRGGRRYHRSQRRRRAHRDL
ncbi:MAG: amidohydrolase family protein [Acidobacteriia bacterium]|nr:amidohydrolase family protein [Terriglobia bacterium]